MDKRLLSVIVFFAVFLTVDVVSGSEWTAVPPPMVYSCKGKTLQLLWTLQIDPHAETVDSIKWFFRGTNSSELVATFLHGQFLPGLKYSGRVDQQHGSGVTISDVTPSDSGTYSIEVILRKGDAPLVTLSQSVSAQVGDGLMVENGQLKVTMGPVAMWDATSSTWQLPLLCGRFTYKGKLSPISVEWLISTGETRQSSGYHKGFFYLALPRAELINDVSYTCRIPERFEPNLCGNKDDTPRFQAELLLDEATARLTLAEAELGRVGMENAYLHKQLTRAEKHMMEFLRKTSGAESHLQKQLTDMNKHMMELQNLTMESIDCSTRDYTVWDDPRKEVTNSTVNYGFCDTGFETKWYRLSMDGQNAVLAATCPPKHRCGTYGTAWLDLQGKQLPNAGHDLVARVCCHWDNSCCERNVSVTVRNCGGFFVYKLEQVPHCYGYCFQKAN